MINPTDEQAGKVKGACVGRARSRRKRVVNRIIGTSYSLIAHLIYTMTHRVVFRYPKHHWCFPTLTSKSIKLNPFHFDRPLHPKTQLPRCSPSSDPLLRRMELRHRWYGCDPFSTQLRQLISVCGVDVYKPVHVTDAEAVDGIWRMTLPLRSKTGGLC